MDIGIYEVLAGVVVLFLVVYYYMTSTYDFWKNRGIVGPKPILFFGNMKAVMSKMSLADYLTREYEKYKNESMFGVFSYRQPILVVKDPEYIKDILVKDFTCFADRGNIYYEKIEPLKQDLINLEPARWRPLRAKLSPTFTSGKLKEMFYLLTECADHLGEYLKTHVLKNPIIECRELTAKFTTDVIGVCAFGLKMNALDEEDSQFRTIGRKVFEPNAWRIMKVRIREMTPWLYKLLGPLMYDHEVDDFFIGIMKDTMAYRKKNNIKRHDFVDLLIDIKDNPDKVGGIGEKISTGFGAIRNIPYSITHFSMTFLEMTDELITAQAFVFFLAGFETSSSTMSHVLYELALNQSIQNKIREEINEILKQNNGHLQYETVKTMKYMHQVYQETLRKYPPVTVILRKSTESYTFSGSSVTIPEGTSVLIPIYSIQHDPQIYPDPEKFDPERFNEENSKQRHPSCYLSFGSGPRNCIGGRFANYQSKVGLIKILNNYIIDVCAETCIPYIHDPKSYLLKPMDGIKLIFTKIQ